MRPGRLRAGAAPCTPAVRSARTAGESSECAGEAAADHARNTGGRPMSADCHFAASIRQPADYGPLQSTQYRPRNIACTAHLRQFVMGQLSRRPMPEHRRCRDQYIGFLKMDLMRYRAFSVYSKSFDKRTRRATPRSLPQSHRRSATRCPRQSAPPIDEHRGTTKRSEVVSTERSSLLASCSCSTLCIRHPAGLHSAYAEASEKRGRIRFPSVTETNDSESIPRDLSQFVQIDENYARATCAQARMCIGRRCLNGRRR